MAGTAPRPNQNRPMAGIALMLLAYLSFSCIDTSAKWLALAGIPALQLAFMRYLWHFVISAALIARNGLTLAHFGADRIGLVVARAIALMASTVLNFISVRYLPLTLTSTILFSAPLIICALSGPVLGEKVGVWRWSAVVIGFIGILVAIRPFGASFHWAVFLSLAGAFCFAAYSLMTRKLAGEVSSGTMQLYSGGVGTAVLAPFALVQWQAPAGAVDWLLLVGLGFFGWIGHEFLTRAHGFAPASLLSPFSQVFIIYLGVWSFFIFDTLPDQWTVVGALIISAASMTIWLRERRLARALLAHPGAVKP